MADDVTLRADALSCLHDIPALVDRLIAIEARDINLTEAEYRLLDTCRRAVEVYKKLTGPVSSLNRQKREAMDDLTVAHVNALHDEEYRSSWLTREERSRHMPRP